MKKANGWMHTILHHIFHTDEHKINYNLSSTYEIKLKCVESNKKFYQRKAVEDKDLKEVL